MKLGTHIPARFWNWLCPEVTASAKLGGSGPKPKPVKNVRVMLTVRKVTATALKKIPMPERVKLFSDTLEKAIQEFLKGALLFLITVSASNCMADDSGDAIKQTPMSGPVSIVRLALGQPMEAWQAIDGVGAPIEMYMDGKRLNDYEFKPGRYSIMVRFENGAGVEADISLADIDQEIPFSDVQAIVRSLGLGRPTMELEDYVWEGRKIKAQYGKGDFLRIWIKGQEFKPD
jgi:hypothetical protein